MVQSGECRNSSSAVTIERRGVRSRGEPRTARPATAGRVRLGVGPQPRAGVGPREQKRKKMPVVLLIDNYDSFTYNLAHRLGELGATVKVVRNDAATIDDVERMAPERIVISPGPGR